MPRSTRFGMKFVLQKYNDAKQGDHCNPKYADFLYDEYTQRALKTVETYQEADPNMSVGAVAVTHPRTIISVMPEGVYIDQVVDLEDAAEAQVWRNTAFNPNSYKENLKKAIVTACNSWARQDYQHSYRADHTTMQVLDSRPHS